MFIKSFKIIKTENLKQYIVFIDQIFFKNRNDL